MSPEEAVASGPPQLMTTRMIGLGSYGRVQLADLAAPIE
jgi:hypothetical protein